MSITACTVNFRERNARSRRYTNMKRYKDKRRVKILNGIKYLIIITVLLLALAFVLTYFVFKGGSDDVSDAEIGKRKSREYTAFMPAQGCDRFGAVSGKGGICPFFE